MRTGVVQQFDTVMLSDAMPVFVITSAVRKRGAFVLAGTRCAKVRLYVSCALPFVCGPITPSTFSPLSC